MAAKLVILLDSASIFFSRFVFDVSFLLKVNFLNGNCEHPALSNPRKIIMITHTCQCFDSILTIEFFAFLKKFCLRY